MQKTGEKWTTLHPMCNYLSNDHYKRTFWKAKIHYIQTEIVLPSLPFDHENNASWKVIALSSKVSSIWTLKPAGTKRDSFPRLGIYSGQASNLLNLPVDIMA